MMGRFHFLVDGWNDDPQELYSIPEVRRFYQTRSDLSGMDKILPLVRMEIARLVRKIINDQPAIEISDLGGEQGRLLSGIDLTGGLDDLSKSITKNSGSGEALDVLPRDSDGAIQKRVTRDSNPVVTLTIGQVTIDLADQVEKIISGYVDRNLAAMEERLSRPQRPAPNSQGATE